PSKILIKIMPNSKEIKENLKRKSIRVKEKTKGKIERATRPDKDERLRSPRSEQSCDSEYSSDQGKLEEKVNKGKRG
ncbi:hypothetical protein, partial [Natrialba sp. PRR66]|uniref:hypothetical protein n=1 Tax=Natrialba sp. PRR66 TaxID=3098146 RepID=UPI002B1E181C